MRMATDPVTCDGWRSCGHTQDLLSHASCKQEWATTCAAAAAARPLPTAPPTTTMPQLRPKQVHVLPKLRCRQGITCSVIQSASSRAVMPPRSPQSTPSHANGCAFSLCQSSQSTSCKQGTGAGSLLAVVRQRMCKQSSGRRGPVGSEAAARLCSVQPCQAGRQRVCATLPTADDLSPGAGCSRRPVGVSTRRVALTSTHRTA